MLALTGAKLWNNFYHFFPPYDDGNTSSMRGRKRPVEEIQETDTANQLRQVN